MKIKELLMLIIDDTDIEIYIGDELIDEICGLYQELRDKKTKEKIKKYGDREIKEIFASGYNVIGITII